MTTEIRPVDAAATAAAVRDAVAAGASISVRSGGHLNDAFPNPDGVEIDLGQLTGIEVDGEVVTIGGGALWGDIAVELGRHGLALTSGDTKSVGIGGLTLGGGIGWMVRQYGLALDSLIAVEVVTASGEIVTASESENADLFWALRGGGGNFGVVTRFTFHAHHLDGVVHGTFDFDRRDLGTVLRGWRDVMRVAPEKLNVTVMCVPSGDPSAPAMNSLIAVYAGADDEAAAQAMAPLRGIAGITSSTIEARAYADVLEEGPPHPEPGPDGELPPMPGFVDQNGYVRELTDEVIDKLVTLHDALVPAVLMLRYLRGAFNRVEPAATAVAYRDSEVWLMSAAFLPPGSSAADEQPKRDLWAAFEPSTTGMYGNFSPTVSEAVTARMYPPATFERLREVKRQWDPANVFKRNHNVAP